MKMFLIICCVMLPAIGVQGMTIYKSEGNSILLNENNVEQSAPNSRDVLLHYVEAYVDAERRRVSGVAMMDLANWSVSHYDNNRGTEGTTKATTTTSTPPPPTNPKTSAPEPTTTPVATTTPAPTPKPDTTTPLTTIIMAHPELPNLPTLPDKGFPTLPEIPTLPDLPWNSCNNKMWSA